MDDKLMEKIYKISRIILAIMTFIVFNIMFINEDVSWKILTIVFALIAFGISFPSSIVSKKIMNSGDKIKNKLAKILFYLVALPIIIFGFFLLIYIFVTSIVDAIPTTTGEFSAELGQGLLALFFVVIGTIGFVVPYIQTLIVLILKQLLENK